MKKIIKVLLVLLLIVLLTIASITVVNAATITTSKIHNNNDLGDADTKMANIGSAIFTTISNIGIVLSVIMLAVLGVKYMMGSAEERAEYKKTLIPYLVGAFLIFGASTIGKLVYNIAIKIK